MAKTPPITNATAEEHNAEESNIESNIESNLESNFITIGDLAKQLGVTTRTIRYYEERGLINPQRSNGKQRIYTRHDRDRLQLILRAKTAGLDLEEAKELVDLYDLLSSERVQDTQADKLEKMVNKRVAEIDAKITEMILMRDDLIDHLKSLRPKKQEPN